MFNYCRTVVGKETTTTRRLLSIAPTPPFVFNSCSSARERVNMVKHFFAELWVVQGYSAMAVRFTASDDEQIMEFVKPNDCLYKVRHPRYRDRFAKDRLWKQTGDVVKKDCKYLYPYISHHILCRFTSNLVVYIICCHFSMTQIQCLSSFHAIQSYEYAIRTNV